MLKQLKWIGKTGRMLAPLVVFCAALVLFCGVVAATEALAKNPGEDNPFEGEQSIILRNDSAFVLTNDYTKERGYAYTISPGKIADLVKDKRLDAYSKGFVGAYGTTATGMFTDRKNNAYLALGSCENKALTLRVARADGLAIAGASSPKHYDVFAETGTGNLYAYGILAGNWSKETDDQDLFVVARIGDKADLYVRGIRNLRYDEKTAAWTQPDLGPIYHFNLSTASSHTKLLEARVVAGDVDGDGVQDIIIGHMASMGSPGTTYRIKVLRVLPVAAKDGVKTWYELKELPEIDTGLDWEDWHYSERFQACENYASAFDIAVGDVDKDGRDEIFFAAAALTQNNTSKGAGIYGRMFKLNDKNDAIVAMKGFEPIHERGYDTNRALLVRAGMGDLDADGAEEPVVLYRDNNGVYLGACKYSTTATNKFSQQHVYDESARAIDLKIGNYSGEVKPGAHGSNSAELMFAVWSSNNRRYTRYMPFDSWQASKRFKEGAGNYWDEHGVDGLSTPGWDRVKQSPGLLHLVIGDFRNKSVRLGAPVHIRKDTDVKLMTIMQEPPKHVDYTVAEKANKYDVVNLTRVRSFYTDFYHSDENKKKTSSSHTSDSHMSVNVSVTTKAGYEADLGPIGKAEASVETSNSVGVSGGLKVAKANESYKGTRESINSQTTEDDYISFSAAGMDIWRYPIVGKYSQVSKDHQLWHTVTMPIPATIANNNGLYTSAFQPSWCNGNLLSYPRDASMIDGYKKENLLTTEKNFSVANNVTKHTLSWSEGNQQKGSLETSATLDVDSSIGVNAKASSMGFTVQGSTKIKVHTDTSYRYTKTSTSTFDTKTDIVIAQTGRFNDLYNSSNQYGAKAFIYKTDAGVVKVSYTVDIPDANMEWWMARYSSAPDPALNLPYLWVSKGSTWKIEESNTENPSARRIRGFFMAKGDRNVDSGIEETGEITLKCRIHNFAVKRMSEHDETAAAAAKNVKVKFEYAAYDSKGKLGSRKEIGTATINLIPVWNNTGNRRNWEFADMPWNITNVPDGRYRIFVTVNPDRAFAELPHHGLRTSRHKEICDNNQGWYDVAIFKPKNTTAEAAFARAEDPNDPMGVYEHGEIDLSFENDEFVMTESEESDVTVISANVRNDGDTPAMNVPVTLYLGHPDEGDAVPIGIEVLPGVFPGESTPVTFRLNSDSELFAGAKKGDFALVIGTKLGEIDADSNVIPDKNDEDDDTGGSSSSGCAAGAGTLALLGLLGTVLVKRRR
ncbi:hypothetical protein LJC31_07525 [Synergistaceae bacterium OttesenSCG-928-I11]|nr:hypothetical protein [Synergistaceae bacterium OttesenSCG-928-I11]